MEKETTSKPKKEWLKFGIILALYLLFLLWVRSWLGLLVIPFIYDLYISKKIKWTWWKTSPNPIVRGVMSWIDPLLFALVAVYFVNLFFFQNYVIPSSSLEKSLLVGDYLYVSKVSYGPRTPQTPLHMPLTQNVLPFFNTKSYIEYPQWEYKRAKGLGNVALNDIVVFNFPAGDTVALGMPAEDIYRLSYHVGKELTQPIDFTALTPYQQREAYGIIMDIGRKYIHSHPTEFGQIVSRPVDRRDNYVKRCVGLPGQTLEIKNRAIYLDGVLNKDPEQVQYRYWVYTTGELPVELCHELGISKEDLTSYFPKEKAYNMPLTKAAKQALLARKDLVKRIDLIEETTEDRVYPVNHNTGWTTDNYGPIWIPAKGKSIKLTIENIAIYERPIVAYEGNKLDVTERGIFINGKPADSYTFRMDYYWMMGDNRHNSADSRFWGFVPEDHIVGKPIFVWLSLDPDRDWFNGHIRWNRFFKWVDNIK